MADKLIKPKSLSRHVSYKGQVIEEFWQSMSKIENDKYHDNSIDIIEQKLSAAQEVVCFMCSQKLPPKILEIIVRLYNKGVRVYVLTNHFYDDFAETIVGKTLIRISEYTTGTMILIDPGKNPGGVIANKVLFSEDYLEKIIIELDEEQIKEAYQYFLWNFWKETDYEIKVKEDIEKKTEVLESPFDPFPLINSSHIVCNNYKKDLLNTIILKEVEQAKRKIIISCKNINFDSGFKNLLLQKARNNVEIEIYTQLQKVDCEFFNELTYKNCVFYGYKSHNNNFIIIDDTIGYFMVDRLFEDNYRGNHSFAIILKDTLITKLANFLEEHKDGNGWQYIYSSELGDITTERIIYAKNIEANNFKENKVFDYQEIKLKNIKTENLKNLKDEDIEPQFNHQDLVKKVLFKWNLVPTFRDKSAKLDNLYKQWEQEKNNFNNYLISLKESVDDIVKEKENSFGKRALVGLKKLFLSKEQDSKLIKEEIEKIEKRFNQKDIIKKSSISELITESNLLADKISRSIEEIDTEIKKESLKIEWQSKRKNLQKEISRKNNEIKEYERKLNEKNTELENIKSDRDTSIKDYEKKINKIENEDEINNYKKELDHLKSDYKKRINNLKSLIGQYEKNIKDLKNDIRIKNDELDKLGDNFRFNPDSYSNKDNTILIPGNKKNKPKKKKNRQRKIKKYSTNLPDDLPEVGTLYYNNKTNKRQLAISYWRQLESGEEEARRLKAELVVERSV